LSRRMGPYLDNEAEGDEEREAIQAVEQEQEQKQKRRRPLDWRTLENLTPPEREWAIARWLGMGHVTLLAGGAGTGKTLVAQAVASCLALRREYLDWMSAERRVLCWFCEDDWEELWRRQVAIAQWLQVPLSSFAGRLFAHSYDGKLVELAALVDQRLTATPMMTQLREQIADYKADVVFLDNSARLFAGNENDRHQVTTFIAIRRRSLVIPSGSQALAWIPRLPSRMRMTSRSSRSC